MQRDYVVKAKFWENIYRKAYDFSSGLAIPNHFQLEESRAVGQTLPIRLKFYFHKERNGLFTMVSTQSMRLTLCVNGLRCPFKGTGGLDRDNAALTGLTSSHTKCLKTRRLPPRQSWCSPRGRVHI